MNALDALRPPPSSVLRVPPSPPDLVTAAQAGDPQALDQLLRQHWHSIERLCRRMCPSNDSFEDLRQDVLVALIRALPSFRGQSAFSTWAFTIVRTCRGRRVRKLRPVVDDTEAASRSTVDERDDDLPDQQFAHVELAKQIGVALDGLSLLDRRILVMRDIEGYSAAEVADATGLTVPAVKTRLHRARVAMRGRLRLDS